MKIRMACKRKEEKRVMRLMAEMRELDILGRKVVREKKKQPQRKRRMAVRDLSQE